MATPFKKQVVRFFGPDGRRCDKDTPSAVRRDEESRKYYGLVPQANGKRKAVPLCSDKSMSQQLLNKLLTDATMRQHGMGDPYVEHRKWPLADHLAEFGHALEAKGNSPAYCRLVMGRLQALVEGCGWQILDELSASQAEEWLAQMRASDKPARDLLTDREGYAPREVARLLGVSQANIRALVKRHGLSVAGQGKARRLPIATVLALLDRHGQGASVQTTNAYLTHLKTFGNWLVRDRRAGENPFRHLQGGNMQVDRRHDRRELPADELRRVLDSARTSPKSFRGLPGWDRYHLYAVACGTGFRASALASLTPESFALDGNQPIVTLPARHAKNRKTKVQPIPPELVELLRDYLREKPAGQPIWGGTWARDHRGAEMLRMDLEAAGIPYAVEGPDGPLFADFHSLRHSFLTLGGRAGIDLRTLQELAGHSTPVLTARYSHRRLHDLTGAIEMLPKFLPAVQPRAEAVPLRATGTEGTARPAHGVAHHKPLIIPGNLQSGPIGPLSTRERDPRPAIFPPGSGPVLSQGADARTSVEETTDTPKLGCTLVAHTPARPGHLVAFCGNEEGDTKPVPETTQPLVSQGFRHAQASPGIASHQRGRRDSNPQPPDRQSGTLTN